MSAFSKFFVEIFRDFTTDGVPASGAHKPIKVDIREWGAVVESIVQSVSHAVRLVKGVASYTVQTSDFGGTIVVDTLGPPADQDTTVIHLPLGIADTPNAPINIKKPTYHAHAGDVAVRGHTFASTTATFSAFSGNVTLTNPTDVAVGQVILCNKIPNGARVATKVGSVITMVDSVGDAVLAFDANAVDGGGVTTEAISFHQGVDNQGEWRFEIQGEGLQVVWSYEDNEWHITAGGGARAISGGLQKSTHSVTATPYNIDFRTANGAVFLVNATAGDKTINLPHPKKVVQGYNPAHLWVRKNDGTTNKVLQFAPITGADYGSANYPKVLSTFLQQTHWWTTGNVWEVCDETDTAPSEINCLRLGTSSTVPRRGNGCAATATVYGVPSSGARIALPTSGGLVSGVPYILWRIHHVLAPISINGAAPAIGAALGNNAVHNYFYHAKADGSVAIAFGVAGAGDAELVQLHGVKVNLDALNAINPYAARYGGKVVTNGAGQIIFITDETGLPDDLLHDTYYKLLQPAQITAQMDDYAPTGWDTASLIILYADTTRHITGFKAPPSAALATADARKVRFYIGGGSTIVLDNASASSQVANRLQHTGNINCVPGASFEITHNAAAPGWHVTGGSVVQSAASLSNGTTGDGQVVLKNNAALVAPQLGAATATSINGLTISTSTGALTISNSKMLAVQSSMTLTSGVDGNTYTMPSASDTMVGIAAAQTLSNKNLATPVIAQITNTSTIGFRPNSSTFASSILTCGDAGGGLPIATVSGGAAANAFLSVNAASGVTFNFNVNAGGVILQMVANQPMDFYTNNLSRMILGASGGLTIGSPTGGNKGDGTLNATAVYDDNVLLTDYVFDKYLGIDRRGEYSSAVLDCHDALDAAMFDVDAYSAHWRGTQSLYGMPSLDDVINKKHSLGGMIQKLWQTVELQAIHADTLSRRIAALDAHIRSH